MFVKYSSDDMDCSFRGEDVVFVARDNVEDEVYSIEVIFGADCYVSMSIEGEEASKGALKAVQRAQKDKSDGVLNIEVNKTDDRESDIVRVREESMKTVKDLV